MFAHMPRYAHPVCVVMKGVAKMTLCSENETTLNKTRQVAINDVLPLKATRHDAIAKFF